MGDNLVPNELSIGCKVIYSRGSDPSLTPNAFDWVRYGVTHSWHGHYCSVRAFAVNPARRRPRPYGLRGLTAQRGQARADHAKNAEKRVLVRAPNWYLRHG